jgi:hypothetical protein
VAGVMNFNSKTDPLIPSDRMIENGKIEDRKTRRKKLFVNFGKNNFLRVSGKKKLTKVPKRKLMSGLDWITPSVRFD